MFRFESRELLTFAVLILMGSGGIPALSAPPPNSSTDVQADATQPSGFPLLVTVTLTNTGDTPISYGRSIGGGPYPDAGWFVLQITDAKGKVRTAELSNGQLIPGSGVLVQLQPAQSVDVPGALDPLPVGSYTIQVGKGKSAKVTVKDDAQLARKREQELLEKLRQGNDVFAEFLFRKYQDKAVSGALLKDLLSDDSQIAGRAASTLCWLRKLPKDAGAVVPKALEKQLEIIGQQRKRELGVLASLGCLAAKVGTDEALAAVLDLARSDMGAEMRAEAMNALGPFRQAQAVRELHDSLQDPDWRVRLYAARVLAERRDPAAIPVLVEVARDTQSQWRQNAYQALASYPNDPQAIAALKAAGQAVGRPSFAIWGPFLGPVNLLQDPLVQADLKLTEEEIKKIKEIDEQTTAAYRDGLHRMSFEEKQKSARVRELHEELFEGMQKGLARVLTPAQQKRLWQINLQSQWPGGLQLPDVQEKLHLTDEQREKIRTMAKNADEEVNDIAEGPRGDSEEPFKRIHNLRKAAAEKITGVLTEAQKRTWKDMIGKPFDFQAKGQGSRRAGQP